MEIFATTMKGWSGKCKFFCIEQLGEGAQENRKKSFFFKKLTNVSLYVCMSAENSEMLVFVFCFFPQQ